MGYYGILRYAGKVRLNTKRVPKKVEQKTPLRGRANIRKLYNKRFHSVNPNIKNVHGPNKQINQGQARKIKQNFQIYSL